MQCHRDLCEKIGANVDEVTHAMGLDTRIGGQFLKAGRRLRRLLLPKDVQAFVYLSSNRSGLEIPESH